MNVIKNGIMHTTNRLNQCHVIYITQHAYDHLHFISSLLSISSFGHFSIYSSICLCQVYVDELTEHVDALGRVYWSKIDIENVLYDIKDLV